MNIPILNIINYIKDTIDIISTLKVDEILSKYKKGKSVNTPEDFEGLLRKEEASLRQHIALENKLKLDYETLHEKINSLEAENSILKKQINEQKENYEKKIEEINKENINLTNMKNDIQKNERKLRKKLDIKEKEIYQLQSKLNSINSNANNNGEYSNNSSNHNHNSNNNTVKIVKNVTSNTPFYSKKNVDNLNNINYELISKKGRNNNKFSTINANSNSMHRLNKCNSMSKINYKNNISEKENIFNDININQNNLENNTIYAEMNKNNSMLNNINNISAYNKGENISIIKKIKNDIKPNNANANDKSNNIKIINEKNQNKNNLNHSSINIKENNERNIIGNILDVNANTNNSIDTIKIEQKSGNNYVKIKENKLLIINQKQPNRLKRTFSAINSQEKNNNNNQKEKLKIGRDITPDKLNQNINNSILKINDNSTGRKFYLLKKTPKKNGYKNSMPNIKGMNIYKNNIREINQFQFLSNKMGNNNNYKIENYSHLKYNDYKRISPQNKILGNLGNESNYNFNNTNIINNKIIQKEGNINNNIIIINGEIVEQNNKDEYPLISINKNNISLKRVSLKSNAIQELNKTKK